MDVGAVGGKAREVFITGLRNQHAVEKQAIELLERQIDRTEHYPELLARMRQHLEESRVQQQRLEELLGRYDESHSGLKDAVLGLIGNMAAIGHAAAQDEVVKNSLANFAFENWEIASYKSLIFLAGQAGDTQAPALLQQSLGEEQSMAQWLEAHLEPTLKTYLSRLESGETAGI